jgi:hypothetical protein
MKSGASSPSATARIAWFNNSSYVRRNRAFSQARAPRQAAYRPGTPDTRTPDGIVYYRAAVLRSGDIAFRLPQALMLIWATAVVLGVGLYLIRHAEPLDTASKAGLFAVGLTILVGNGIHRTLSPPMRESRPRQHQTTQRPASSVRKPAAHTGSRLLGTARRTVSLPVGHSPGR